VARQWISHVGTVIEHDGELLLVESTTLNDAPCCITGKRIKGVQAHPLEDRIRSYNGKVWVSALNRWQTLSVAESKKLTEMALSRIGTPYDDLGCLICGGLGIIRRLWRFTPGAAFCSELRHWFLTQLDKQVTIPERSGRVSPAPLARAEDESELFEPLVRLR